MCGHRIVCYRRFTDENGQRDSARVVDVSLGEGRGVPMPRAHQVQVVLDACALSRALHPEDDFEVVQVSCNGHERGWALPEPATMEVVLAFTRDAEEALSLYAPRGAHTAHLDAKGRVRSTIIDDAGRSARRALSVSDYQDRQAEIEEGAKEDVRQHRQAAPRAKGLDARIQAEEEDAVLYEVRRTAREQEWADGLDQRPVGELPEGDPLRWNHEFDERWDYDDDDEEEQVNSDDAENDTKRDQEEQAGDNTG